MRLFAASEPRHKSSDWALRALSRRRYGWVVFAFLVRIKFHVMTRYTRQVIYRKHPMKDISTIRRLRYASAYALMLCTGFLAIPTLTSGIGTPVHGCVLVRVLPSPIPENRDIVVRAALAHYIARRFHVDVQTAASITREAFHAAQANNIKPTLILAVAAVESSYQPHAVNAATGARGLMQVLPRWHEGKVRRIGGERALFRIKPNIEVGAAILAEYLHLERGRLHAALGRYWGSMRCGDYVRRVQAQLDHLNHIAHTVRPQETALMLAMAGSQGSNAHIELPATETD